MQIEVNITRGDMVWLNLLNAHRAPGNWSLVTFICLGYFGTYLYRHGLTQGSEAVLGRLGEALIVAVAAFAILFSLSVVFSLLGSSKKSGVTGKHLYQIEDNGLRDRTEANDTLVKWTGIRVVTKTRWFIFVRVNWYMFHFLPRRCFQSGNDFNAFYEELHLRWENAAT